jgi:hypothetical protein
MPPITAALRRCIARFGHVAPRQFACSSTTAPTRVRSIRGDQPRYTLLFRRPAEAGVEAPRRASSKRRLSVRLSHMVRVRQIEALAESQLPPVYRALGSESS